MVRLHTHKIAQCPPQVWTLLAHLPWLRRLPKGRTSGSRSTWLPFAKADPFSRSCSVGTRPAKARAREYKGKPRRSRPRKPATTAPEFQTTPMAARRSSLRVRKRIRRLAQGAIQAAGQPHSGRQSTQPARLAPPPPHEPSREAAAPAVSVGSQVSTTPDMGSWTSASAPPGEVGQAKAIPSQAISRASKPVSGALSVSSRPLEPANTAGWQVACAGLAWKLS